MKTKYRTGMIQITGIGIATCLSQDVLAEGRQGESRGKLERHRTEGADLLRDLAQLRFPELRAGTQALLPLPTKRNWKLC